MISFHRGQEQYFLATRLYATTVASPPSGFVKAKEQPNRIIIFYQQDQQRVVVMGFELGHILHDQHHCLSLV